MLANADMVEAERRIWARKKWFGMLSSIHAAVVGGETSRNSNRDPHSPPSLRRNQGALGSLRAMASTFSLCDADSPATVYSMSDSGQTAAATVAGPAANGSSAPSPFAWPEGLARPTHAASAPIVWIVHAAPESRSSIFGSRSAYAAPATSSGGNDDDDVRAVPFVALLPSAASVRDQDSRDEDGSVRALAHGMLPGSCFFALDLRGGKKSKACFVYSVGGGGGGAQPTTFVRRELPFAVAIECAPVISQLLASASSSSLSPSSSASLCTATVASKHFDRVRAFVRAFVPSFSRVLRDVVRHRCFFEMVRPFELCPVAGF